MADDKVAAKQPTYISGPLSAAIFHIICLSFKVPNAQIRLQYIQKGQIDLLSKEDLLGAGQSMIGKINLLCYKLYSKYLLCTVFEIVSYVVFISKCLITI